MELAGASRTRKPSLFAQRINEAKSAKKRKANESSSDCDTPVSQSLDQAKHFGDKSFIVSGPEADEIHKENTLKLAAMSQEEIEAERNKLLSEMDPKLIEFLTARKNRLFSSADRNKMELSCSEKINTKENSEINMETEVDQNTVAHELAKEWPSIGTLEEDKLKWMEELPRPKSLRPEEPYNARFNFDGTLLPFVDEKMDIRQGLHHHGEEPERPGYTVQELIQLSRSSITQQRIIALKTLANVLEKANLYVDCFEKPLLPMLLDAELFLLLRFSLDDPSRPIITASLAALCNLLVNHHDEMIVDSMLGCQGCVKQPSFHVTLDLKQNELDELKDAELLRLDVILGALRTLILPRFRFILDEMDPDSLEILYILKSLIRIARHSHVACLAIINCSGLLDSVRKTLTNNSSNYYPDSLKLFRVIACRSENFACIIFGKYSIMELVLQIIAGETKGKQPEAMRLMIECFYLWQTLLCYKLATDQISSFIPVLTRLLYVHVNFTGIESSLGDQEHAVAMLSTIMTAFKVSFTRTKVLLTPIIQAALKWISQFISVQSLNRNMCKLTGAALSCVATALSTEVIDTGLEVKLESYFQSSLFTKAISLLSKHSWLLSSDTDFQKKNTAENLPSLGAVLSTVQSNCILPLFEGLTAFVLAANKNKLSDLFLRNAAWENYLLALISKKKLGLIANHWFARQEIRNLCSILFININCQTLECNMTHRLALTMAGIIHNDDKRLLAEILQNIIFDQQYFMKHIVAISEQIKDLHFKSDSKKNNLLLEAVNNLNNIKRCYELELGIDQNSPSGLPPLTLTCSDKGCEPSLPSDWQFLPVLRLYNTEGKGDDALEIATSSLQWILILEHFQPDIANKTPITARFSRLCCLFLAGNDLFRDVTNLLKELLRTLLSKDEDFDLEGPVPGLNSFYDFYRQLVDHFVSVSYGDPVFGQYILAPVQQRYSVKFRKLIWSEQAPLVRVLNTPVEQLVIPIKSFLEPCETDCQLLATYLQFLATGRARPQWSPVLYKVAVHHTSTFITEKSEHNFAKILKQKIEALGNQELKNMLLNYSVIGQNQNNT